MATAQADTYLIEPSPLVQGLQEKIAAYYSFDINTNDQGPLGNDATPVGSVGYQLGYRGNAVRLPGEISSQIDLPDTLDISQTSFSIAAWVWMDATTGTGLASLVGPLYFDTGSNEIVYRLAASGGQPQVDVRVASQISTVDPCGCHRRQAKWFGGYLPGRYPFGDPVRAKPRGVYRYPLGKQYRCFFCRGIG